MKRNLVLMGLLAGLVAGTAQAGITLNTVSAILIFPGVAALEVAGDRVETFLTITNTGTESSIAHVSFINGDRYCSRYCYECDFDVPMSGRDTETLVLTRRDNVTHIVNLDTGASRSCSQRIGFVTVDVEDADHNVLTDNILLGSEVVVDYTNGSAWSVPAIPIRRRPRQRRPHLRVRRQGVSQVPVGRRCRLPGPRLRDGLEAWLVLFTLAFDRQFPPLTDCSVIGFDAFETQFSNSFQFGCWTMVALDDIDPEFAYPYLGAPSTSRSTAGCSRPAPSSARATTVSWTAACTAPSCRPLRAGRSCAGRNRARPWRTPWGGRGCSTTAGRTAIR